jgi:hypothetical protein
MWRSLLLAALAALFLGSAGCFLPIYPSEPNERMQVLLNNSENYRQLKGEWLRFWLVDQPSHLTFDRTNGGIEPGF